MPIHRHAGDAVGQTGAQSCLASDVEALCALLNGSAQNDVLDLHRVDAGAVYRICDNVAAERLALRVVEGAAIGAADRRAGSGDDYGAAHYWISLDERLQPYAPGAGEFEGRAGCAVDVFGSDDLPVHRGGVREWARYRLPLEIGTVAGLQLPVPAPARQDREFHVVVRSGTAEVGARLCEDYSPYIRPMEQVRLGCCPKPRQGSSPWTSILKKNSRRCAFFL